MKISLFPESISRWLSSKSNRSTEFTLSRKNIYVFPSGLGFVFVLLIALMLLTAINYQNSLIYLLTFFIGTVFFISIWLCFLNLNGIHVSAYHVSNCFVGEMRAHSIVLLRNSGPVLGARLGLDKQSQDEINLKRGIKYTHNLLVPAKERGLHTINSLRIETSFPFGFITAWTWLKLDSKVLVYPRPLEGERVRTGLEVNEKDSKSFVSEDLTELKPYVPGDSAQRIAWKQFAAKDQLIIRHQEQGAHDDVWLKWDLYSGSNIEKRLQYLCFDILDNHQKQKIYGLDIPGVLIAPSQGEQHKHLCLKSLALFGSNNNERSQND